MLKDLGPCSSTSVALVAWGGGSRGAPQVNTERSLKHALQQGLPIMLVINKVHPRCH